MKCPAATHFCVGLAWVEWTSVLINFFSHRKFRFGYGSIRVNLSFESTFKWAYFEWWVRYSPDHSVQISSLRSYFVKSNFVRPERSHCLSHLPCLLQVQPKCFLPKWTPRIQSSSSSSSNHHHDDAYASLSLLPIWSKKYNARNPSSLCGRISEPSQFHHPPSNQSWFLFPINPCGHAYSVPRKAQKSIPNCPFFSLVSHRGLIVYMILGQ